MEPLSTLISWVNPFPSRLKNTTVFFCDVLEAHVCACCLLFKVKQYYCHFFMIFTGSFLNQYTKPTQGIVLLINLFGKGVDSRGLYGRWGFHLMGSWFRVCQRDKLQFYFQKYFTVWSKVYSFAIKLLTKNSMVDLTLTLIWDVDPKVLKKQCHLWSLLGPVHTYPEIFVYPQILLCGYKNICVHT